MPKNDIIWKRARDDGSRCEVKAQMTNNRWEFRIRGGRFDTWELLKEPPVEDWLELYDNVKRRIGRGLHRPKTLQLLKNTIRERFPDTPLS